MSESVEAQGQSPPSEHDQLVWVTERLAEVEARLAEAESKEQNSTYWYEEALRRLKAAEEAIEDFLADYEQGEGSLRASVERLRAALDSEQQP